MENYGFIYKCSFFDSKRHTVSHTDMYYNEEKHTRWVHCTRDYTTVSVIRVLKNSEEYKSAIKNSQQENELVEELEQHEKENEKKHLELLEKEKLFTYEYFMKKFMDGCKEIQWMDGKEEKFRKEWELFKMFNDDDEDEQYFYDYICDKIEEYQNKKYITTLILN